MDRCAAETAEQGGDREIERKGYPQSETGERNEERKERKETKREKRLRKIR